MMDMEQMVPETRHGTVNLVGYDDSIVDLFIPIFTILEFLFYMGWLR